MTEIFINEHTEQGKALPGLIKTFPEKIVTVIDEEDLSNCVTSEEFGELLINDLKKRYEENLSDCITLEEFGEKLRTEVKKRLETKKNVLNI